MTGEEPTKHLFLLDQQIRHLRGDVPSNQRRFHLCGDERPPGELVQAPWEAAPRFSLKNQDGMEQLGLVERALSEKPWRRVAMVCDAGLGKTTNMEWLRAQLSRPGSRVVPLLIRLNSSELRLLDEEFERPNRLLDFLATEIAGPLKSDDLDRLKFHLRKMQEHGRIALLIDGLDHGLGRTKEPLPNIIWKMARTSWAKCPIWLSGRPNAFNLAWDIVSGTDWHFLHVGGLQVPEIRFYLREVVEPDPDDRTKLDWYAALPEEGRELLAIPRFLQLIAGVIRDEVAAAKLRGDRDLVAAVEKLDLRTRADVYRLAYFNPGEVVEPHAQVADKDDRQNRRGLIAQMLDAKIKFSETQDLPFQYLGLKINELPDNNNLKRRIKFAADLLGAIAFEMYAHPNKYRAKKPDGTNTVPQPNTAGIADIDKGDFEEDVRIRLAGARLFKGESIGNEFKLLDAANNRTVDFLVFNEIGERGLAWHDPTVQAFFAACWAMNYAKAEFEEMLKWRVVLDDKGNRLEGFDEFWQFTAEMPDELLRDSTLWMAMFEPSYTPPQELAGDFNLVQWHRRMIYHSYVRMAKRPPQTIRDWRALWLQLEQQKGTAEQQATYDTINFCRCPKDLAFDGKPFLMGSPQDETERFEDELQREVVVPPFEMQDFPVTNAQYELFDLKHCKRRDKYSDRDNQPVLYVTFWDAWCFAKWTGNRLPKEEEWEYACRAGTTSRYHFGNNIDNADCNYDGNVGRTTAKGEMDYPPNEWGLCDMHGNVWEWCDCRYQPGASARVLRGGSWFDYGRNCRSAYRYRYQPVNRYRNFGFRLAAVPVGAK